MTASGVELESGPRQDGVTAISVELENTCLMIHRTTLSTITQPTVSHVRSESIALIRVMSGILKREPFSMCGGEVLLLSLFSLLQFLRGRKDFSRWRNGRCGFCPTGKFSSPLGMSCHPRSSGANVTWDVVYQRGAYGSLDVGEKNFNEIFQTSGVYVLRRKCDDCLPSHQEIYYRRLTNPTQAELYDMIFETWKTGVVGHTFNQDFALYSSFDDALVGTISGSWKFCNGGDPGVGFPRDCAPGTRAVGHQWSSRSTSMRGRVDIEFAIAIGQRDRCTIPPSQGLA